MQVGQRGSALCYEIQIMIGWDSTEPMPAKSIEMQ
jgi:hypothetical protein